MFKFLYLAMTLCAAFGFIYGVAKLVWAKNALYTRMIVYGIGCAMMGRLFITISLFAFGELLGSFNIGMLGTIGSFLFFFTANYGQMDSLVDDGSEAFRKTRIMALIAPAVIWGLYAIFFRYAGVHVSTFVYGLEAAVIGLASYFHLKHILIEDVDFGLIKSLKRYNILALAYAVVCMLEMIVNVAPFNPMFTVIVAELMCLVLLLIIPELEKGVRQWTM